MIELGRFEKCIIQGESGKFLIDKGRVLEWTEDRTLATVYHQYDADFKMINWPNTLMTKIQIEHRESDWPAMKIEVEKLGLSYNKLCRLSGINKDSWSDWLQGFHYPTAQSESRIKNWLDSL